MHTVLPLSLHNREHLVLRHNDIEKECCNVTGQTKIYSLMEGCREWGN